MKHDGELFEQSTDDYAELVTKVNPVLLRANVTKYQGVLATLFRDLAREKVKLKRQVLHTLGLARTAGVVQDDFLPLFWEKAQDAINFRLA